MQYEWMHESATFCMFNPKTIQPNAILRCLQNVTCIDMMKSTVRQAYIRRHIRMIVNCISSNLCIDYTMFAYAIFPYISSFLFFPCLLTRDPVCISVFGLVAGTQGNGAAFSKWLWAHLLQQLLVHVFVHLEHVNVFSEHKE